MDLRRLRIVLPALALALVLLGTAAPVRAQFGYLRALGCSSAAYDDPRSIGDAESIAVPLAGDVVYVLDNNSGAPLIRKYSAGGTLLASWGPPSGEQSWGDSPRIAVTPDGVLVAGRYPDMSRLQFTRYVVNGRSAQMTARWTQLDLMSDLAFIKLALRDLSYDIAATLASDTSGNWYVQLHTLSPPLDAIADMPGLRYRSGAGIATGGGLLWVADNDSHGATPSLLMRFAMPRFANGGEHLSEAGRLEVPFQIAGIDRGADAVWVAASDDAAGSLWSVAFDGNVTGRYRMVDMGVPRFGADEIGVDGKGRVFVLDRSADEVTVLGPGGTRMDIAQRPDPCRAGTAPPLTEFVLTIPARQRVLETRTLEVDIRCDVACRATATGRVAIAGRAGSLPLVRDVNPNLSKRQSLRMRISRRTAAVVRSALGRGRRVTATVRVTATGRTGATVRRSFQLALSSRR